MLKDKSVRRCRFWANLGGGTPILALALLLGVSSAMAAGTFRVNAASAAGSPTGLSWASAFQDIQDGVNAADQAGGGEVWVARGTYTNPTSNSMAVSMAGIMMMSMPVSEPLAIM